MKGLNEAVADAQSTKKVLKRRTITIEPVKVYKPEQIKLIRKTTGLSQNIFANCLGVSVKTVEAWERGKNSPNGTASRLLSMLELDNSLFQKLKFIKISK